MDRSAICDKYLDAIPHDLYEFQEEALLAWFDTDTGVLVTAPTGMGKTLIAEAALYEALLADTCVYYTTPLIALTEQKFRDMQDKAEAWGFSRDDVGLVTGNRTVNPEARILIVVAEILLNHLLSHDQRLERASAVVMDEFHYFNDRERGVVWELSLVLLPAHVRLLLLSATVGNARQFIHWLHTEHGRKLVLVETDERRVPLEYQWVGDKLMTDHLTDMVSDNDADARTPALVFCFNRDECWEIAERLKGLKVITADTRKTIEAEIDAEDFKDGVGPKLRQMLIRGVGVHHAGVLPKHKEVVERLFLQKLVPFVICTETLAAGVNLPARSVVLSALIKGKPGEKKLVAPSSAHQMFGRAGRPQFDTQGYVFAMAHEDDAKIEKWRKKYDQLDPNSKDPGILRARKDLERKKPSRRKTQQYWTEGQFQVLQEAGPANLYSQSMIPYQVAVYLLTRTDGMQEVRRFLTKRFNSPERLEAFQTQFDAMVANMEALGYLEKAGDDEHFTPTAAIDALKTYRSVDPLYGEFMREHLAYSSFEEKIQALESALEVPRAILRRVRIPDGVPVGPLQEQVLLPLMISMGVVSTETPDEDDDDRGFDPWDTGEPDTTPRTLPDMLRVAFEAKLPFPETIICQPKWIAGRAFDTECDFYKTVRACELVKQEGLVLRHLLRLVILSSEFYSRSEDPDYQRIGEMATRTCHAVDPRYTDKFLAQAQETQKLLEL